MNPIDSDWQESIAKLMNELVAAKRDLQQKNSELQEALDQVKLLKGLLPICGSCKNIRDDEGYWKTVENYISTHSEAKFSHSICPSCMKALFPDINDEIQGFSDNSSGGM